VLQQFNNGSATLSNHKTASRSIDQMCIFRVVQLIKSLQDPLMVTKECAKGYQVNGPFSGTTQVSRYQKGKTNLDFTEARVSEWQWHQLGHMQIYTSLQTTTPAPHHSVFYRPDALPATQPTASTK